MVQAPQLPYLLSSCSLQVFSYPHHNNQSGMNTVITARTDHIHTSLVSSLSVQYACIPVNASSATCIVRNEIQLYIYSHNATKIML